VDPDGDSVIGEGDRCPGVAGPVENGGCPDTDTDGDAVVDRLDRCPAHPSSPKGRDGCPLARIAGNKILILEQVHFATDQDVILSESFDTLDEVAQVMLSHLEIQRVLVEGHTDSRASDAYNLDLSRRRAASVMNFLLDSGIAVERVCSAGFGRTRPLAGNDTEEGMALNRRVEFTIQPPVEGPLPPCPPDPAAEQALPSPKSTKTKGRKVAAPTP
jgi:outer membrane protein OmpA-like peptidoglycan-associated protein